MALGEAGDCKPGSLFEPAGTAATEVKYAVDARPRRRASGPDHVRGLRHPNRPVIAADHGIDEKV